MNKAIITQVSGSRGFWSGVIAATMLIAAIASVSAGVPRPEHPRPDAFRENWSTLNGPWQFEIDQNGDGEARGLITGKDLGASILVPFCPESKLSGLGLGNTQYFKHVWYRRMFE
ncbi:MAG: beta-galactosidase, partial [Verrucomicrobia bacterium]|nr:beta-galactosidase [Verrucomicrobiota bacterium]